MSGRCLGKQLFEVPCAGMCLQLENAQDAVASALRQRTADAANDRAAREAADRQAVAAAARAAELAAHLEAACDDNAALSAQLKALSVDNASLQVTESSYTGVHHSV